MIALAENTYARDLTGLYVDWQADAPPSGAVLVWNGPLAASLGLSDDEPLSLFAAAGVAQGYAGHQFGGYSPRLGDGRALLVGEALDPDGRRFDIHLKGSGRTPFARGGDGKAAVGPMLREHVISEAMNALGIPTTRTLAVVRTGELVIRESGPLPGAALARIAASHLRVGTFEYVAHSLGDRELLSRLTDYATARHYPQAGGALELFEAVVAAQASLIAQWMLVGFVHGVMNTDNMTISGETIDYGPCAFMEAYDPATVFSSIDHGGRYAYGNQPSIAQWNLARLAESLLPLIDADADAAVRRSTAVLSEFPERFMSHWRAGMQAKLGLAVADEPLTDDLLALMQAQSMDWTLTFRGLAAAARGDRAAFTVLADDPFACGPWLDRWLALTPDADAMDAVNPLVIPRNELVEDALIQATVGDLEPYERLVDAVTRPYEARPGFEAYAAPAGPDAGDYVTYCGT